jgi:hypothetical protein
VLCPHCSQEIEAGSNFCRYCGQRIDAVAEAAELTPPLIGELQMGKYLQTGWQVFKQYPQGYLLFTLIYLAILAIISRPWGIGWLAAAAIHEPLVAGYIMVTAKLLQQKEPTFSDFFEGFQFRYFLPLVLVGLISQALVTLGLILLIIPGLYLAVGYLFAAVLVVDRGLDFWPAMETSRRLITPRWFSFFAFLLLLVLVNFAGLLALGVGFLVSFPVSWCALVAGYADLLGLKSDY